MGGAGGGEKRKLSAIEPSNSNNNEQTMLKKSRSFSQKEAFEVKTEQSNENTANNTTNKNNSKNNQLPDVKTTTPSLITKTLPPLPLPEVDEAEADELMTPAVDQTTTNSR